MNTPRDFPSVDKLKRILKGELSDHARTIGARQAIAEAKAQGGASNLDALQKRAEQIAMEANTPSLGPVFNLTGVVLHTGLGRARLAPEAARQIFAVANNHAPVELDVQTGKRGDRQAHVSALLCELTGAEDAFVVNNCAAAVCLSLMALCAGREIILSRGQMVEIGGAFRMPDIVRVSGAHLVEVGCTNRTRISDFKAAVSERTAAILQCHTSNFKVIGFTEHPSAGDLASLAHEHGCLFIDDLGSGCLLPTEQFGLPHERTLQEAVAAGADLVLASGDKLLGATQAGIILGSQAAISTIKRHPMARAMRVDKLTLAGLEATLRMVRDGRWSEIPTWKSIGAEYLSKVKLRAQRLAKRIPGSKVVASLAEIGGGSMPGSNRNSFAVTIKHGNLDQFAAALRKRGVFGRQDGSAMLLDVLTLDDSEVAGAAAAILSAMEELS